jgi:PTS system mannose-specific IID component
LEIDWLEAALVALAAYLAMSVWPFGIGYFTLYRPLIGGTIVGLILGDARQGMAFGAALNAVHLGFISTGGSLPSDLVTAGYIGTALALVSDLDVNAALAAFGIPLGVLGGFLWFGRMTLGSIPVHWADAYAERGDTRGVATINLWAGQGLLFLLYGVPTFVIVYYGQLGIDGVLGLIPDRLIAALSVVGGMLPAVGIGLLLRSIGKVRLLPFFLVGFVLSAYLNLPILVIALLGASAAWLAAGDARPTRTAGAPDERDSAKRVPRRVLWGAWRRWVMYLHASYNYERLQGLGFAHALKPAIEYLYETTEERARALKRHLVLFNSEPQFGALVPAAVIAMEEQRASGEDISDETINGVKSGLMGPLAGVGDSLIQGLVTPLLLSMGISLAQGGSLAGPVLYSLIIAAVVLGSSRAFWSLGYRWGRLAVSRILTSGWVSLVSDGTAVLGMTVIGGLTATLVQFSTPASVAVGPLAISLQQDVLDTILRGLLPLALTLSSWWLLSRRVSSMRVIGLMFLLGIDLTYLGLAGWDVPPLFSADWVSFLTGGTPATVGTALAHLWPPLAVTGAAVGVLLVRRKTGLDIATEGTEATEGGG